MNPLLPSFYQKFALELIINAQHLDAKTLGCVDLSISRKISALCSREKKKIIFRVSFVSNKFRNRSTVQSVLITRGHRIRITVRSTINESTGGIDRKRANFK